VALTRTANWHSAGRPSGTHSHGQMATSYSPAPLARSATEVAAGQVRHPERERGACHGDHPDAGRCGGDADRGQAEGEDEKQQAARFHGPSVAGYARRVEEGRRRVALCPSCGEQVELVYRFCPWCAAPQRRKLVEFFRPHPAIEDAARALRVSRYLGDEEEPRHTRFSIWDTGDRVSGAVSLDDAEAGRLARFLVDPPADTPRRRGLRVRSRLRD